MRYVLLLCLVRAGWLQGQPNHDELPRSDNAALVGVNALLGGTVAALHAWLRHEDVPRAFAIGTLGGAVHLGGKLLATRSNAPAWVGIGVTSVGASMVANAGEGRRVLEEVTTPVGFLRLRLHPYQARKVTFAVNAYEVAALAVVASQRGVTFDQRRSLSTGTLAFSTGRSRLRTDRDTVLGFATGPIIVLSEATDDPEAIARHEEAHVHQYWFLQATVDAPLERELRRRSRIARRLPSWIELGVVSPARWWVDIALFGHGGLYRLRENEAEILERR